MVGITSFGFYIPVYRLKRDEISRVWKTKSLGGERTVAGYDEDSLTMAVSAILDCMKDGQKQADSLFFASTTSPFKEKQTAAIIAAAVDLNEKIQTADFTDSLRSGTIALNLAVDAVKSGSCRSVIIAISDSRMGVGKSQFEQLFGDGAVALEIGSSDVIASIEASFTIHSEFIDTWRLEGDPFVQAWEERFILNEGYFKIMESVISGILEKYNLTPKVFTKVILFGPDWRTQTNLAKRLGFDIHTQVQDLPFQYIGNAGVATVPIMLVNALTTAHPGDKILIANYGDGADAFILHVTENIERIQRKEKMKEWVMRKIYIDYEQYLNWRGLVPVEEMRRPEPRAPSVPCLWRDRKSIFALYGNRCNLCGTVQYPPQRICVKCQGKDSFEDYKLSDKKGKIFTYSFDSLTSGPEIPTIFGVIDFEEGGRLMCEITDCEPSQIRIGMPVEMCFRKVTRKGNFPNYFWKARPLS